MGDELELNKGQIPSKVMRKKKNNIRIFVQRKRLASKIFPKSTSKHSNSIERLTSIIEKNSKRNKKSIIVVNYKPVFVRSRPEKPKHVEEKSPQTPPPSPNRWYNKTTSVPSSDNSKINYSSSSSSLNRDPIPFDIPDVEDPLMFIEMMYQQLFTEDGQLRSGTEPTAFASRMKQIVTQSRRNSMVRRDSVSSNIYQPKYSTPPRFPRYTFSEDEEPQPILQRNRTANASRRSSKQSSIDHGEHQQQLHAFLNSYYHHPKNQTVNTNSPFSIDDTDNEDLDTFSDLNSYRKNIRLSPPPSIDEDTTLNDSKYLPSSGYQSLKSPQTNLPSKQTETNQYCCPNCVQSLQTTVLPPPTTTSVNLIQPVRDILMKYLNFILISKNILLVPLFIFFLRQRSIHINN